MRSVGRRRPAGCDPTPTRRRRRRRTKPTAKLEERRCICRRCGDGACTSLGATCPTATRSSSGRMASAGRRPPGAGPCRPSARRGGRGRRLVVRCCTNVVCILTQPTLTSGGASSNHSCCCGRLSSVEPSLASRPRAPLRLDAYVQRPKEPVRPKEPRANPGLSVRKGALVALETPRDGGISWWSSSGKLNRASP